MTGAWGQILISDGNGGALPPLTAYGQNVKAHGAKGDGHTDDSDAFNSAAAAGKCVYVPPGNYIAHGIALRNGARWVGYGGGYPNEGSYITTITTNSGDLFVPSETPGSVLSGISFEGIRLGNTAGGGHLVNFDGYLVLGATLRNTFFDLQLTGKSAIRAHCLEFDRNVFSGWGISATSVTVPMIDIVVPYATGNTFSDATLLTTPEAVGYCIHLEATIYANANTFARMLFTSPCGGAIKILSAANTVVDQVVVSPEGYVPINAQAFIHIGKSAAQGAPDSARVSMRSGWHGCGTANNPSIGLYDGTTDVSLEGMYVSYLRGNGSPVRIVTSKIDASEGITA